MKVFFGASLVAALGLATLVAAQTEGLNNSSKRFTDPAQVGIDDMDDPAQIRRTWDAAIVMVPDGPGRSKQTSLADLDAAYGEGQRRFPTAIYMHGCAGLWSGSLLRMKFLADNGFLVIGPASMARTVYARSCDAATHESGMFRPTLSMRQLDAGYAIETAKGLPFVDADNMLLIGLSEGGVIAATFKPLSDSQRVAARVVEGWTCKAGWYEYAGLNAPEDEPVLSLVGAKDPWYRNEWNVGHCGEFMDGRTDSKSVVYETGQLASRHELLEFRSVQEETMAFLRQHIDLPLSVREVQQLLTDLGYDPGPVDGAWGAKTLAALNALRAAHGLPEVGALDESSLELLAQLRKG